MYNTICILPIMHAQAPLMQYTMHDNMHYNMHIESYACYNEGSATTICITIWISRVMHATMRGPQWQYELQYALQYAYCQLCMLQWGVRNDNMLTICITKCILPVMHALMPLRICILAVMHATMRDPQQQQQLLCNLTAVAGKVKFLHCLAVCSGLLVKETHINKCCGKNWSNLGVISLHSPNRG